MKNFKQITASTFVVLLLFVSTLFSGFAEIELPNFSVLFATKASAIDIDGTCGTNLTWSFNDETGLLKIEGTGAMTNYYNGSAPWSSYKADIVNVSIGNNVTSIGNYAFCGLNKITSVEVPDSVTIIGFGAFYGCNSLTSISLPFVGTSRTANNNVNAVFGYIFGYGCVTSSGSSVTGATYQYGKSGYYYHYYIPSNLRTVTITDTKQIPYCAFYGCSKLTSVSIPSDVTSIGEYAFYNCTNLATVSIPTGITIINNGVFYNCKKFTSIEIPSGVTSIGESAFYGCELIESIEIPNKVTSIGDYAFCGLDKITSVEVPDSVTIIGFGAFYGCNSLTSISLPFVGTSRTANNNVNAVFGYIFGYDCVTSSGSSVTGATYQYGKSGYYYHYYIPSSLRTIVITDTEQIPYMAFYNCNQLTSIVIPNSINSIGDYAFSNLSDSVKVLYCGTEIEWDAIEKSQIGITDEKVTYNHEEEHLIGGQLICEPTCTEKGIISSKKCSICGKEIVAQIELPENGHTEVVDNSIPATCTESGLTEGSHCSVCGEAIKEQETVSALGHSFGEWVVTTAPTCTENGVEAHTCTRCNYSEIRAKYATGHTVVVDNAVAPTCTEAGKTEGSHCSTCDTVITAQEVIPATGHTFGEWIVVLPSTTEKEGLEERTCHCGEKETRSIPKINSVVVSVKLNTKNVETNYNRTFKLTPNIDTIGTPKYKVEYTSSNPKVVTVFTPLLQMAEG